MPYTRSVAGAKEGSGASMDKEFSVSFLHGSVAKVRGTEGRGQLPDPEAALLPAHVPRSDLYSP